MKNILLPIDGSKYSDLAVDYVVNLARQLKDPVRAHLVNVQLPMTGVNVKIFVSKESLKDYYHDEGTAALASARQKLEAAGIAYEHHIGVGDPGQVIIDFQVSKSCDAIVMGTHGRGAVAGAVMGSVATRVVHLAKVPVVLVK